MEEVLDLYQQPYDPKHPVVCMDETSKQLVEHSRPPIAAKPGHIACEDDEYRRAGVASIFLAVEPITGHTVTEVTQRRTRIDFAHFLRRLCDEDFKDASRITLVSDNLNTHSFASLYEAFEAEEARRVACRFELKHTPKHGSWLNMAEIELSVLSTQCLDQRIGNLEILHREVQHWTADRNSPPVPIRWRFTTKDARIKLRRLYPSRKS